MSHALKRGLACAATAIALAGASVGWAAKAEADDDQLVYLQLLNLRGVAVYNTAHALRTGYEICEELNYATGDVVAQRLWLTSSWSDIPTIEFAEVVVLTAVEGLCPQHDHRGQARA